MSPKRKKSKEGDKNAFPSPTQLSVKNGAETTDHTSKWVLQDVTWRDVNGWFPDCRKNLVTSDDLRALGLDPMYLFLNDALTLIPFFFFTSSFSYSFSFSASFVFFTSSSLQYGFLMILYEFFIWVIWWAWVLDLGWVWQRKRVNRLGETKIENLMRVVKGEKY